MGKRHKAALTIIRSATNISGVATAIVEAFDEMRAEQSQSNIDPAVRLMVYQLNELTQTGHSNRQYHGWTDWVTRCKELEDEPSWTRVTEDEWADYCSKFKVTNTVPYLETMMQRVEGGTYIGKVRYFPSAESWYYINTEADELIGEANYNQRVYPGKGVVYEDAPA